jgi:hypothetical protein
MTSPSRPTGTGKASPRPLRYPVLSVLAADPNHACTVMEITKA